MPQMPPDAPPTIDTNGRRQSDRDGNPMGIHDQVKRAHLSVHASQRPSPCPMFIRVSCITATPRWRNPISNTFPLSQDRSIVPLCRSSWPRVSGRFVSDHSPETNGIRDPLPLRAPMAPSHQPPPVVAAGGESIRHRCHLSNRKGSFGA